MNRKVLCVCVGNISRSPMMQAVLQRHLGTTFLVESAGLTKELAGRPANYRSVACMKERGVDLSGHLSRWIGELDLRQYRWIVCVGHDEANQVRSTVGAAPAQVIVANEDQGGIPDPYELGLAGYRDCLALLDRVMPQVAQKIRGSELATGKPGLAVRPKLLLIRHCQTIGSHPDVPLSDAGAKAAEALVTPLHQLAADAVYSSHYERAQASVRPFAVSAGLSIGLDDRLCERVHADRELEDRLGHVRRSFAEPDYQAPGGESLNQTMQRALAALADIAAEGHRLAAVSSHRNLIASVLRSMDAAFGFEQWLDLRTPDLFEVELDAGRPIRFMRLDALRRV